MSNPHILHLDDFSEGQVIELGTVTASADDILAFGCAFDPQSFHTDREAAGHSPFHGLIASGWHTAALSPSSASPLPAGTLTAERCGRVASCATIAARSYSRWCWSRC